MFEKTGIGMLFHQYTCLTSFSELTVSRGWETETSVTSAGGRATSRGSVAPRARAEAAARAAEGSGADAEVPRVTVRNLGTHSLVRRVHTCSV